VGFLPTVAVKYTGSCGPDGPLGDGGATGAAAEAAGAAVGAAPAPAPPPLALAAVAAVAASVAAKDGVRRSLGGPLRVPVDRVGPQDPPGVKPAKLAAMAAVRMKRRTVTYDFSSDKSSPTQSTKPGGSST